MLKKANSDLVRRQNRGLVLETLRQHGPLARITLGYQTGLSPASITSISSQLIDEGLVYSIVEDEEITVQTKRGRPQTRLALNPQATNVLAVSISVDGVELVFADFSGTTREPVMLRLEIYPIPKDEFGPRIAQEIKSNAKRLGIALHSIKHIGVAVQGVADTITGEISWSPAFRARDIPIVRPLERLLGIPCSIANNANMIAEALLGMDRNKYSGTTAVVFMGHGIGLGLILNGSVYSGATGRAAEFGHMNHLPDGPLCRCGRHGCLEAFSADYGIMRMANDRRGTDFDIHAAVLDSDLRELELAAKAGDTVALNAFLRAGEVLGFGIARLIALINPQRVVLAGRGTRAYGLMKDSLGEALRRGLVHDLRKNVEFEVVPYDKDMITTGTLVETLRHLDRDVFAIGQKAKIMEFTGRKIA
ncbi:MAG TPA: ROK family transcriptional regulator [Aestuariivirga sp.]|jgi:predicted NBD/HSP70 family sugar kinase|nr:ROK family transcriptional regulator [Aestuariivirga sp.]